MLPISRSIFSYSYLFYFFMLTVNLPIQHIQAADHEGERSTPPPTVKNSIGEAQAPILGTTSTETFSFTDIYHIELSLNISGDIELIATEGDVITVILEKQARATNTKQDDLIRAYLDNITFIGTQSDDTLQLRIRLPSHFDGNKTEPICSYGSVTSSTAMMDSS